MADPKDTSEEEDKVEAAYENISKKLESIRSGKTSDDDGDSVEEKESSGEEEELEEWKGPKPPVLNKADEEEEDIEFRKVKLKNLNRDKDDQEEEPEKDSGDDDDEEEEETEKPAKRESEAEKEWEPEENDPLDDDKNADEENDDSGGDEPEPEGEDEKSDEEPGHIHRSEPESNIRRTVEPVENEAIADFEKTDNEDLPVKQPQPDSLDDLTDERAVAKEQDEEDYFIPSLKPSGQRGSDLGINAQRESFGASFGQRSSMDNSQGSTGNDPNNFFSQHSQNQPVKRANKFHLLVLVIIGIAVIGFTVYILKGGFGEISLTSQPSPSPSPVETPVATPTPTPEPDRAQYKVRILNGSGKTGLAKTVADKLKELGYQIEKTGNATNSAFTQTIVRVKSADESAIAQVVKDLAPEFDAAGNTSLKSDDAANIEIILGAK